MKRWPWWLPVTLALIACRAAEQPAPQAVVLPAETLAHASRCTPGEPRVAWFGDADALVDATGALVDRRTAAAVDWTSRAAVGVWLGERPTAGYGLVLEGSERRGQRLTLRVRRETPPADALVAQVITHPCLIVTVPRTGYREVEVVDRDAESLGRVAPAGE